MSKKDEIKKKRALATKEWLANNKEYVAKKKREYLEAHPEQARASNKKWLKANKEKARAANIRWQKANPEKYKKAVAKASKQWRENNLEHDKARHARWRAANKEKIRLQVLTWYAKLRTEVFTAYGGICVCCKESNLLFLSIAHINDDGSIDRRNRKQAGDQSNIYRHLKKLGFPKDRYCLQCFNCNMGSYRNNGICPHRGISETHRRRPHIHKKKEILIDPGLKEKQPRTGPFVKRVKKTSKTSKKNKAIDKTKKQSKTQPKANRATK